MIIRTATLTDIPSMLPLVAKTCAFHQALDPAKYGFLPNPEQRYMSWLDQLMKNSRHVCLVAEDSIGSDPVLVALLIATVEREIPIYRVKEYGFIHDLWVEEAYRHRGVARQLIQRAIEHFRQVGVEQVRLDTAANNEIARKLFTTCGFRVSMVEMLIEL
ncbi:GNAT family N-acetyltransferase [Thermocoleostomius sinensis]|uniref:GNAT family N-acetyltransferase n=1 Tax=Thermocoleostomius sinensis A174 TaxID=2016057 RepID=A0A9E9CB76_9CYAN|nr:GNAT family N-acetyltransferase [Thermocoleostomius sinensis]WAL59990.1 GNAT family N-acetyltransferase [Thermocoleostomius sinensis A174]